MVLDLEGTWAVGVLGEAAEVEWEEDPAVAPEVPLGVEEGVEGAEVEEVVLLTSVATLKEGTWILVEATSNKIL